MKKKRIRTNIKFVSLDLYTIDYKQVNSVCLCLLFLSLSFGLLFHFEGFGQSPIYNFIKYIKLKNLKRLKKWSTMVVVVVEGWLGCYLCRNPCSAFDSSVAPTFSDVTQSRAGRILTGL